MPPKAVIAAIWAACTIVLVTAILFMLLTIVRGAPPSCFYVLAEGYKVVTLCSPLER